MKTNNNLQINKIKNLVWDFNGTLLDDFSLCMRSINHLLAIRNHKPLTTDVYLNIFTFPIRDYYAKAGFDFNQEPFEKVAIEFMDLYLSNIKESPLHENVVDILSKTKKSGYRQIILSAMEVTELRKLAKSLKIEDFFEHIHGIDNHMAASKVHLAQRALLDSGFSPDETCLIGDTLHDAEVAAEAGTHCILISKGHQSKARLETSGVTVLNNLKELEDLLLLA